ncbi:MAG: zf-HC2 domain-containing protein [Thermoguttaceae bacterium]
MFCCKKAARLLSESLDRKLTFWQRVRLRFHLSLCGFCRHFDHDLHLFDAALRRYSQRIDADAALEQAAMRPEARERILLAMKKERS